MTQQPFFQQYPQAPAPQQFPPAYPQQAPAQQPYPPQGYPAQQYPAPQQQAPAAPPVNGTLDDYFNQPSTGGGPSISWKDKQIGTTYAGIVARDVTNADVQQDTDFTTKQPKFYRDGRPKFVMKVPLKVQPTQEFPEGEAAYFVRGQARDELVRAMSEAGATGAPQAGAVIQVTLVQRKPNGQGNPTNVVQISYTPPAGGQSQQQQQQQQIHVPAQEVQVPQQQAPAPEQVQQPVQQAQQAPPQQFQAPAQQQIPNPGSPQPPSDLSAEQQALLARLTGGQG